MKNRQMTPPDVYAVILAGGSGTRFWPKSRLSTPKQLCAIGGGNTTMLERTLSRLDGFIPPERRLIVTHKEQLDATKAIVKDRSLVLGEPEARNTANALCLAALQIHAMHGKQKPYPVMISLHADHVISDEEAFIDVLTDAIKVAREDYLTLLGIFPEYPETGYGYIEQGPELHLKSLERKSYKVNSFREKPDQKTAQAYIQSGNFLWNAGYFVWKTDIFLEELRLRLPQTVALLEALSAARSSAFLNTPEFELAKVYTQLPKIAIDHAVMEVSQRVAVIPAKIGWQDVGSWDALSRCFPLDAFGNFRSGDTLLIDTKNSVVESDGPFVATLDIEDMVVVAARGAILVCPKNRSQDVKRIVDWLNTNQRKELT